MLENQELEVSVGSKWVRVGGIFGERAQMQSVCSVFSPGNTLGVFDELRIKPGEGSQNKCTG